MEEGGRALPLGVNPDATDAASKLPGFVSFPPMYAPYAEPQRHTPLRFMAFEPNVLGKMMRARSTNNTVDSSAFDRGIKHYDYVYQTQTLGLEIPFMMPSVQFPFSGLGDNDTQKSPKNFLARKKALMEQNHAEQYNSQGNRNY